MIPNAPIGLWPGLEFEGENIDTIKAEVETHRNGADPNDDLTMMCLRL
jgi:hypothetical protein